MQHGRAGALRTGSPILHSPTRKTDAMNTRPHTIAALLIAALAATRPVVADPAPFGLALGASTTAELAERFTLTPDGINRHSGGEMFTLEPLELGFDGLESATIIMSREGVLLAVLTSLPKQRFNALFDMLADKYELVASELPFVGNQYAKFIDGNTEIILDAPHLSFSMELNYIQRSLREAADRQRAEDAAQKRAEEASRL